MPKETNYTACPTKTLVWMLRKWQIRFVVSAIVSVCPSVLMRIHRLRTSAILSKRNVVRIYLMKSTQRAVFVVLTVRLEIARWNVFKSFIMQLLILWMFITSPVRNPETLAHPALTIHAYTISDHSILSQTEITQRWPTQLVYLSELSGWHISFPAHTGLCSPIDNIHITASGEVLPFWPISNYRSLSFGGVCDAKTWFRARIGVSRESSILTLIA